MNLKELQSQMIEAGRTARRMKEIAGVLEPHPGVRQAFEEMSRVRAHLASANAHLAQIAFPPNWLAVELAESLSMMTARIKPIMDQMPRLGLDLPALQAIRGLDIGVAESMLQIQQVFDNMPRFDLPALEILRGLDQVPAIAFPPLLKEPEWLQALHSAAASLSASSLDFPDILPDEIADLVEREFAAVSMEVAADTGALEGASALEFALALLQRLGELIPSPGERFLLLAVDPRSWFFCRRCRMPARLRLANHLSEQELFTHYQAAQQPIARTHWQVVWMVSQSFRTEDISDAVGYSPTWIRKLVGRYNAGGPAALGDQRRRNPGAEPLLGEEDEAALRQALKGPLPGGDLWSGVQVARWMSERLGRPVGRQRGWEMLRRLGYTPQRPRPRHADADPEAQAAFQGGVAREAGRRAAGASRG
ncbi:MAG TPA: winged helix-turn-helix domain-containing protein [Chloroflexota bacterium]|nr:winged helix-turn-helix domain-containing protein [Chloroflexota bacterium]